jgi:hypothetical protein
MIITYPVYTVRPGLRALLTFSWFPRRSFHFLRRKSRKIGEIDSAKSSTRMYEEEGQKSFDIAIFMHEPVIAETDFKINFKIRTGVAPKSLYF